MQRNTRPPALAFWLLSRTLRGARQDALMGDLEKEYQRGRSQSWYWRQALLAIASHVLTHRPARLVIFGALRLVAIAGLIIAATLDAKWPLFLLVLDPSWSILLRWHRRHRRASRGGEAEACA